MRAVMALATIVWVHLGDGVTRAKVGESLNLEHTEQVGSSQHWTEVVKYSKGWDYMDPAVVKRPARPPPLVSGKRWLFIGLSDSAGGGGVVETRNFIRKRDDLENTVVVFQEGFAMPTQEILRVVNTAHAVLVLRGTRDYFYLRNDFVLSTHEEEALVEWGVGRPLFANSVLAVGGTLMVAYAEKIWGPAVVGTLLVAAAGYLVQGALTKVVRVSSPEWKSNHKLIPSGIHGTERAMQGVLVTLVALADLLDDNTLLMTGLICATVQVVLLEYVGQARLTWGRKTYNCILCIQIGVWTCICTALVAFVGLSYVFPGFAISFVWYFIHPYNSTSFTKLLRVIVLGSIGVGIWSEVFGWDEAGLMISWQSLQPWKWPLLGGSDSWWRVYWRIGLWFCVLVGSFTAVFIIVGVFSFRISSDRGRVVRVSERTRARKVSRVFSHYHETYIPSRNLLVPGVAQQPAPVAPFV